MGVFGSKCGGEKGRRAPASFLPHLENSTLSPLEVAQVSHLLQLLLAVAGGRRRDGKLQGEAC